MLPNARDLKLRINIMERCKPGKHSLVVILSVNNWDCSEVVRWCRVCGSVVVDIDVDNRTQPGRIMKMRTPQIAA